MQLNYKISPDAQSYRARASYFATAPEPAEPRHFRATGKGLYSDILNTEKDATDWVANKITQGYSGDFFVYEAIKKIGPEKPVLKTTVLSGYKETTKEVDEDEDDEDF